MQIHTTDYVTSIKAFIFGAENAKTLPYFDTANPPKATVGLGVNLEISDYLRIVLQTMGLFDGKTNAEITAIQQVFSFAINETPKGSQYNSILQSNLNAAPNGITDQGSGLTFDTPALPFYPMPNLIAFKNKKNKWGRSPILFGHGNSRHRVDCCRNKLSG